MNMYDPKAPTSIDEHSRAAELDGSEWPFASGTPGLEPWQVHLWSATQREFSSHSDRLWPVLSEDEQAKSQRFRSAQDRSWYVTRHGLLRRILSWYLQQDASEIKFSVGANGKPEIDGQIQIAGQRAPLYFNASDSGEIVVWAITAACPVGVDIECMRTIPDIEQIASRFFSPRETRTLMSLPADSRLGAFYACWTRKEAFLKATGEGITQNLAKVEVTLAPGEEPKVLTVSEDSRQDQPWQLRPFSPAPGYLGCLAYRHTSLALSQYRIPLSFV